MPARSVCLVTLSLSEAGPGRFGGQVSVTDIYYTMPYMPEHPAAHGLRSVQFSSATGAPTQTSTISCHTIPCPIRNYVRLRPASGLYHTIPCTLSRSHSLAQRQPFLACPTTFSSCCHLPAVGPGGLRWGFFFFGWGSWQFSSGSTFLQ